MPPTLYTYRQIQVFQIISFHIFPHTLAWLFKVGIERAEEAVNNSVGEAAGEFFQNIGEVPVST